MRCRISVPAASISSGDGEDGSWSRPAALHSKRLPVTASIFPGFGDGGRMRNVRLSRKASPNGNWQRGRGLPTGARQRTTRAVAALLAPSAHPADRVREAARAYQSENDASATAIHGQTTRRSWRHVSTGDWPGQGAGGHASRPRAVQPHVGPWPAVATVGTRVQQTHPSRSHGIRIRGRKGIAVVLMVVKLAVVVLRGCRVVESEGWRETPS